ncbi:MAG: sensor histidine kinase [Clostridiales bacterium]|nr:sensor histidine kinase [Clostridiales bacterium]
MSILLLCAVMIVTAVSLRYTRGSIFENSSMYTQTIISQLNQNIDSYINYMENIADMLACSEDVQEYLFGEAGEECQERLLRQFDTILESRKDIRNVGIISVNGQALINDGTVQVNENLDLTTQEWYTDALENETTASVFSSHVQHVVEGERSWVIALNQGVENTSGSGAGVVFIDLNYSAISELCDQSNIGDTGYVFILDPEGNIVYHPHQQQLYNELQTENTELVMTAESDTVQTGSGSGEKLYCISRSENTGWLVAGCMDVSSLLADSNRAQSIYVLTAILLVAAALLVSSIISRNITLPISRLRDSMAKVQEGDFTAAELPVPSENEIGSLTVSFNVMTRKIQEMMAQMVREQEEKRKLELRALQSQINPHFLYNTLDSIIWMAEGKKNEEVVIMTSSLARLFRQSISNEDEVVPLMREVEYARNYLTIQKMRFKDKLEFRIDVAPDILNVPMIKLVLQPIIENAIYHGLKVKENKGLLLVTGRREGENVVIRIMDDGVGMDNETLSHIFERHKVNYQSNGVGVYNVQKRLQLYYGSRYGIRYESCPGEGTTAIITIPLKLDREGGRSPGESGGSHEEA